MIFVRANLKMCRERRTLSLLLSCFLFGLRVKEGVGDTGGIDLGGGVMTQTNVEHYASLVLDLRDMERHIQNDEVNDATNIYMEGYNSGPDATGSRLSLHRLSSDLAKMPLNETGPSFLYHLHGLTILSTDVSELQSNAKYADVMVRTYLTEDPSRATNAIVVLNMWMYAMYLLHQGLDRCYKRSVADNPDVIPLGGGGMDEFISLWIGKEQTPGRSDGYGLYSWSQEMGNNFGQNDPESPANSDIKLLYQQGITALSFPNACTPSNIDTMPYLWSVAQRMISKAAIPLMQALIYAIANNDQRLTSLYSKALIPQVAQCRPSVYKRLKSQLLGIGATDFSSKGDIIADLQQVYQCLGFTCQDVGVYAGIYCEDKDLVPLAEYNPSMDVKDASRIDLDILQIKILTSLESYQSAKHLYLYGRNYPLQQNTENDPYLLQSLHKMATTSLRRKAGEFYVEFTQYYGDIMFSDTIVLNTLDGLGKYGNKSKEYRYEIVAKTIQYQIVHMFAIAQMTVVQEKCDTGNIDGKDGARHIWDHVAALLIGSLEGTNAGGSLDLQDGQLSWNLANKRAFQFSTMGGRNYAVINEELEDLLYAGLGALEAPDCQWFLNVEDNLQHLLLVPLLQSVLRFAILSNGIMSDNDYRGIAAGEIIALTILPHIASHDENTAAVIKENLVTVPGSSVPLVSSGPQELANALFGVISDLTYGCEYIGQTQEVDACAKARRVTESDNYNIGTGIAALAILLVVGLWVSYVYLANKEDNEENNRQEEQLRDKSQMTALVAPSGNIEIASCNDVLYEK